ncbi:hypothetical protein G7Y89_g9184 [Cudoniella acicularis]|uniref:Uncharacterized protein n=1 Tax=Cudoniella acicularis TaxID=354080 RepID=A0A8H4RF58_9HELO|nr:hypothetical protein G7Y89_g9184 [Cudoniella acicularis]
MDPKPPSQTNQSSSLNMDNVPKTPEEAIDWYVQLIREAGYPQAYPEDIRPRDISNVSLFDPGLMIGMEDIDRMPAKLDVGVMESMGLNGPVFTNSDLDEALSGALAAHERYLKLNSAILRLYEPEFQDFMNEIEQLVDAEIANFGQGVSNTDLHSKVALISRIRAEKEIAPFSRTDFTSRKRDKPDRHYEFRAHLTTLRGGHPQEPRLIFRGSQASLDEEGIAAKTFESASVEEEPSPGTAYNDTSSDSTFRDTSPQQDISPQTSPEATSPQEPSNQPIIPEAPTPQSTTSFYTATYSQTATNSENVIDSQTSTGTESLTSTQSNSALKWQGSSDPPNTGSAASKGQLSERGYTLEHGPWTYRIGGINKAGRADAFSFPNTFLSTVKDYEQMIKFLAEKNRQDLEYEYCVAVMHSQDIAAQHKWGKQYKQLQDEDKENQKQWERDMEDFDQWQKNGDMEGYEQLGDVREMQKLWWAN